MVNDEEEGDRKDHGRGHEAVGDKHCQRNWDLAKGKLDSNHLELHQALLVRRRERRQERLR